MAVAPAHDNPNTTIAALVSPILETTETASRSEQGLYTGHTYELKRGATWHRQTQRPLIYDSTANTGIS